MKKITIYSTPTCVYCNIAKDFFKEHGFEYEEKNVLTDLEARKEMVKKSEQMGVPVIEIGDKILVGYDQATVAKELGI